MTQTVKRNVHVYKISLDGPSSLDIDSLFDKFSQNNINNNILDLEGEKYLFVSYKKMNNLLSGIFVKVKDVSQVIIEKRKSILSFFKFLEEQDPGEPSNLLWDIENGIIIGELNWAGARYLSLNFGKYITESINRNTTVSPIPHEEAYKALFLRSRIIKRATLKVPRPHVNLITETYGLDVKDIKKYTEDDEDLGLEITLTCKRQNKGLIKDKLLATYRKLVKFNGDNGINFLVKDNRGNVLELLDDAYIKHKMEFNIDEETKTISKEDFFNKVRGYWIENMENILKLLQDA